MIRFIPLLLSFLFFFSITELHAGAAEKWEYDVIPDQSQILQVKGHKVDQYGAAVNDYEYNTKIDPKTSANKAKMGKVGFGRLLKISGWGLLGYEALAGLLEAVDWVIDPEAQSIWRHKKDDGAGGGGYTNCDYKNSSGKKVVFYSGNDMSIPENSCPLSFAENYARQYSKQVGYEYLGDIQWVTPLTNPLTSRPHFKFKLRVLQNNYVGYTDLIFDYKDDPNQPNPEELPKEYLTPEQLADYANHTHPDYSNPELAPKLDPKYSPEIASDLWKPSNPWEEINSPTVQEVTRQLEQSQPEPKKDPEITPNPETGGMTLPSFCSLASPICEFIKWVKEPPESPESIDVPEKEIDKQEIKKDLVTLNVRSCPADIRFDVQNLPFGIQVNKGVQMQPICDTIEPLKYVFQLMTFVFCGFILLRV